MAKPVIAGRALVITSTKKAEDIKFLERYNPEALYLFEAQQNGTNKKIFELGVCTALDEPLIKDNAVVFNGVDAEGFAQLTTALPSCVDNLKEFVADCFGSILANIADVEHGFDEALAEAKAKRQAILDAIEVGA